jgi:DNA-binding LacI/PurR family transcriptional regulator
MISVLHVGLPLGPPWLTEEEGEKIAARLAGIRQKMQAAGYRYVVLHASPDGELNEFRERLRTEPIDAVLIGGGVAGDPKLAAFKQQIIDAAQAEAPKAKILEFDHAVDVQVLVGRAFGMF